MKVFIPFGFVLLLVMLSAGIYGQTYKNIEIRPRNTVVGNMIPIGPVTTQLIEYERSYRGSLSNDVHIRQVGLQNIVDANMINVFSDVDFVQLGSYNEVFLQRSAVSIEEFILQQGNNNILYDIGKDLERRHRGLFVQYGSNQRLIYIGSNSISERMRVRMKGKDQTVIIRNISRN